MTAKVVCFDPSETESADAYGDPVYLGRERLLDDRNYTRASQEYISGEQVRCILVKNGSTGTLQGGTAVKESSQNVVVQAGASDAIFGFVPDGVNVPSGHVFWCIVEGPAKITTSGASAIAVGERLVPAASGRVAKLGSPSSASEALDFALRTCGVALEAAPATPGAKFRARIKCR